MEKKDPGNKFYSLISGSLFLTFLVEFIRSVNIWIEGLKYNNNYHFNWLSFTPVVWGLFIIINFIIVYYYRRTITEAFFYGFSLAVFGGWLYEIPLFLFRGSWPVSLDIDNFLLVNNHVVIPGMIYYFNRKIKLRPLTFLFFLLVSAMMAFTYVNSLNPYIGPFPLVVFIRLPTQIFLSLIILDVFKK